MTTGFIGKIGFAVFATALMCGCANSGFDLSTASVTPDKTAKADPVCASLASEINTLKGDGTIDKLEKAADGKGAKVSVKRTALQKQAELNKAYSQFQTRCGPPVSNQVAAQRPPQSQAPGQTPAATSN